MPPPGDTRYRDRRLLVLYFDLTPCRPPIRCARIAAAQTFIDAQIQPTDLLAIMTFGGGAVRVKQDFTADRGALRERHPDADLRRRQGRRRHSRQHRHRHRLRPGRCGVQHPEHRSPVVGAADGGDDAAGAAGAEGADLFRQRPAAERRRQPGAAARHDQRRDPRQRRAAPDRRARPGRAGAARRRVAAVARRHRHVHRPAARRTRSPASNDRRTRSTRWPRTPAARDVRLQRPVARHRAGGAVDDQLLHARLLQHPPGERRPLPSDQDLAAQRRRRRARLPAGVFQRQGRSPSSPPPTRSASSKRR